MFTTLVLRPVRSLLLLLMVAGSWFAAPSAHAQYTVNCDSFQMDSINFGSFSPFESTPTVSGALSFRCYSTWPLLWGSTNVAVCLSIGSGSPSGNSWDPRLATINGASGAPSLGFDIYQGGGRTIWGSAWKPGYPAYAATTLTVPPKDIWGNIRYVYNVVNFNAAVMPNQTMARAGTYQSSFDGNHTQVVAVAGGSNPSCTNATSSSGVDVGSGLFPFSVTATVTKYCEVSASDMNFGPIDALAQGRHTATSTITTRCTRDIPYQIALEPQNGASDGRGMLHNASTSPTDPDTYVSYGLFQDTAATQPWGKVVGSNTKQGTGNSLFQTSTVTGLITNVNVVPANYTDTVRVTVSY